MFFSYTQEEMERALNLFHTLAKAYKNVSDHANRDSKEHGLNPTEYAVLELLYIKGPQKLQQIGSKLLLVSGNVTYVIDKLEKNGWIYREKNPKDKRSVYANLSEKGRQYFDEIYPIRALRMARVFSGLSEEEQVQLIELLKKAADSSNSVLFR
ncbi:MAG: MarR family transcriptional regulator [Bacillaceae bacterium]|jgi:MarR family 2-MHQ and catechol resistance regulon transcriptional repressor|uniref:MarR family transcriptional regulator n=2 Tax=Aeribacillus TaxID=1055323 RepID=A0A165WFI5_9BACI|nr:MULTISPECIES: MarR family transcriptional regulator [Aeribacillus]REJ14230.1 MAG: MarR family transcriptional regulator [Bacillaceae bacterium]KZM53873.1 MarR family transcriptional regulator [Aeribacillus pallidus]KZN94931.1 MarR family transcriptional regulator [Aeribacillus pallidus]MDR9794613.1 MarR family transcriptional regulator [Aeribacillus pallidus]MDR9796217.1 MarR family transcriptional regulator [Aeribacillus pallidus]